MVESGYRVESDVALTSDWLPAAAFTQAYSDLAAAQAVAIEGLDDPAVPEVRVVEGATGIVVWRSTDEEYE